MAQYTIYIRPGITLTIQYIYNDSDGNPVDLTGANIRSQVKEHIEDTTSVVDWSTTNGSFVITDAVNGTFELQFPNADATNGLIRIA